jgi:hypothetical protein
VSAALIGRVGANDTDIAIGNDRALRVSAVELRSLALGERLRIVSPVLLGIGAHLIEPGAALGEAIVIEAGTGLERFLDGDGPLEGFGLGRERRLRLGERQAGNAAGQEAQAQNNAPAGGMKRHGELADEVSLTNSVSRGDPVQAA